MPMPETEELREPRGVAGYVGEDCLYPAPGMVSEPDDRRPEDKLRSKLERAHKAAEHHAAEAEEHRGAQRQNEADAEAASRALAILGEARHGPSEGAKPMASPHRY